MADSLRAGTHVVLVMLVMKGLVDRKVGATGVVVKGYSTPTHVSVLWDDVARERGYRVPDAHPRAEDIPRRWLAPVVKE